MTPPTEPHFNFLIGGRFWLLKCLLVVFFAATVFSALPVIFLTRTLPLPPAYALKSKHPLADTSNITTTVPQDDGERMHGAKLTPRIFGAMALYLVTKLSLNPYLPATLGGIIFFASGIWLGYRISNDRLTGLLLGLTMAGLYAASACFIFRAAPKPFDGVAIGMIGLVTISLRQPILCFLFSSLACWTDERSIVSLVLIGFLALWMPGMVRKQKMTSCIILGAAVVAYAVGRLWLAHALHWQRPDTSLIGWEAVRAAIQFLPIPIWMCFEGGWPALLVAAWSFFKTRAYLHITLLVIACAIAIGSCLLVLDISRATSFAFPLIPAAFAILASQGANVRQLRYLAAVSAAVSLLVPNIELSLGGGMNWLPTLPAYLLIRFSMLFNAPQ